jgi:hypothetical protein
MKTKKIFKDWYSVADSGFLSRIPDPDFLTIPDPGSGTKNSSERQKI